MSAGRSYISRIKVNTDYYMNDLFGLMEDYHHFLDDDFIFQQDGAPRRHYQGLPAANLTDPK